MIPNTRTSALLLPQSQSQSPEGREGALRFRGATFQGSLLCSIPVPGERAHSPISAPGSTRPLPPTQVEFYKDRSADQNRNAKAQPNGWGTKITTLSAIPDSWEGVRALDGPRGQTNPVSPTNDARLTQATDSYEERQSRSRRSRRSQEIRFLKWQF